MQIRGEVCVVEAFTNHPKKKKIVGFAVISASQLRTYINIPILRDLAVSETQETLRAQANLIADKDTECKIVSWKVWPWTKLKTNVELRENIGEQPNPNPLGWRERTATE